MNVGFFNTSNFHNGCVACRLLGRDKANDQGMYFNTDYPVVANCQLSVTDDEWTTEDETGQNAKSVVPAPGGCNILVFWR